MGAGLSAPMFVLCVCVGAASSAAASCEQLVPKPFDVSPIRSSQALHTVLANKFAGKNVVEIGTRNGDGLNCFSRVANHTFAIEMTPSYCHILAQRRQRRPPNASSSNGISSTGPPDYDIKCVGYQKAKSYVWDNVDYITWWIEGELGSNMRALSFLHGVRGQLRPGAVALIAHDATDLETPAALTPIADYTELVLPSQKECLACLERLESYHGLRRGGQDGHVLRVMGCNRTTSITNLLAIKIDGPQLAAFLAAWKSSTREVQTIATRAKQAALATGDYANSAILGTCRFAGNVSAGDRRVEFTLPRTRNFNLPKSVRVSRTGDVLLN